MTYRLNPELVKVLSPVVLVLPDGTRLKYQNGTDAASATFEKRYTLSEVRAIDSKVEISLEEASVNNINWIGEEAVSFF